jgi:hypothetical protein
MTLIKDKIRHTKKNPTEDVKEWRMRKVCLLVLVATVVIFSGTSLWSGAPSAKSGLETALEKAKALRKPLFIQVGRETCGSCQDLKSFIKKGWVNVDDFVYVDLDYDNETERRQFQEHFKVSGSALPFVVIADSNGKQITARSGAGLPDDYKALIKKAAN